MDSDGDDLKRCDGPRLITLVRTGLDGSDALAKGRARLAWRLLVAREYDRVRGLVAAFRFPGSPYVRVHPDDRDDAAQDAFGRLLAAAPRFRGTTHAEYLALLRRCVEFACMDSCRRSLARERRTTHSLDHADPMAGTPAEETLVPLVRQATARHAEREQAHLALMDLSRSLDGLGSERQRTAARLWLAGFSTEEIAERLGTSVASVKQLRARALRKLRGEPA